MRRLPKKRNGRAAFTIVEVLVVVALILVLLSIIVVAVGSATRTAQRTNTSALMSNIKQALVHFENEVGYLPPVLTKERDLVWDQFQPPANGRPNGPDPSDISQFEIDVQQWYSVTTLAEYLIGYGPENEDGHDGAGIRNPGPDGFWGASIDQGVGGAGDRGTFEYRTAFLNDARSASYRQGRVYGPYLQLSDERLLGAINPDESPNADGQFRVFFPGEAGYNDTWPKVIVDYWGEPIRYYRKPHPVGGLNRDYRRVRQSDGSSLTPPSLADVYLLRPWDAGRSDVDTRFADDGGDTTATADLLGAGFALFSSGPDRRFDQRYRRDDIRTNNPTEFNRDNIVELGP